MQYSTAKGKSQIRGGFYSQNTHKKIKEAEKMKRIRFHYYFLSIVSLISLICIGFSSWTLVQGLPTTATGTLTASPIYSVDDYITFDTTKGTNGIECLQYNKGSFILNSAVSENGKVIVYYNIDVDACKADFGESAKLKLSLYLRGANTSGTTIDFSKNTGALYVPSCSYSGITTANWDYEVTTTNVVIDLIIDVSSLSGTVSFSAIYNFVNGSGNFMDAYNLLGDAENGGATAVFYAHARIEKA